MLGNVSTAARDDGTEAGVEDATADSTDITSRWMAASSDPEHLAELRAKGWHAAAPADHPFTDDYADLLRYLHVGF